MPLLYKSDTSPPSRAVMMMADLLNIKMEYKDINPVTREQDEPEILKKNPMRTIPILEDNNGFCLADSHAIIIYLITKYGKEEHLQLYPDDEIRATIHQRLFFDCGVLFQRLRAIMGPTYFRNLTTLTKAMRDNMDDAYTTLEYYLNETSFIACNHMTIADISLVATVSSMDGMYPIEEKRYPKTKSWLNKMSKMDVCIRINEPGNAGFVTTLKTFMENNASNSKL